MRKRQLKKNARRNWEEAVLAAGSSHFVVLIPGLDYQVPLVVDETKGEAG